MPDPIPNHEIVEKLNSLINQMTALRDDVVGGETEEERKARWAAEKGICTYCGEKILPTQPKPHRGAHSKCYRKIIRAIESGEISDSQAIRRGWFLSPDRGGRKAEGSDPIAQEQKGKRKG